MSIDQTSPTSGDNTYVLGHVDAEIRRLLLQSRLFDNFTEHSLRLAGLRPGMRVLDVGCGPGDVSFVASRLVGSTGTVLGVDAEPAIIELARTRAAEQSLANVRFEPTAITDISLDEPVDAVIGRFILVHLSDPVAALRQFAAMVRPGGFVAFWEADITRAYTVPDLPLWRAVNDVLGKALQVAGLDPSFGTKLHLLFRRAGLGAPRLMLGAPLSTADDTDILAHLVQSWRAFLPVAERLGLIPDDLADLDTLAQRLQEEAAIAQAIVVTPPLICASTQPTDSEGNR